MFSYITIQNKVVKSLLKLSVSLPEKGLALLEISWKLYLRKGPSLFENYYLLTYQYIICWLHVLVANALSSELQHLC